MSNGGRLQLTGLPDLNVTKIIVSDTGELDVEDFQGLTTDDLRVTDGSLVHVPVTVDVSGLVLSGGSQLVHAAGEQVVMAVDSDLVIDDGSSVTASIDLTVNGDLTIERGGSINADCKGHDSSGPGGGGSHSYGGGGYGRRRRKRLLRIGRFGLWLADAATGLRQWRRQQ